MAINTTLEALSDQAFGAAAAAYTVGLVCAAVEFSSRRSAARHAAPHELVGASARGGSDQSGFGHVTSPPTRPVAPWGERFSSAGFVVTTLGLLVHLFSVAARGFSVGRLPLGNMYEFTSVLCATVVAVYLVLKLRNQALTIAVFVLIPVTILMYVAGTALHVPAAELQPALNSYWKWIHVTSVSISSGILMFSGIASTAFLLRSRADSREAGARSIWSRLPDVASLDRVAYRTAILAFPIYTFAVITGALWAEVAWGRYWNWDPKETCAFITWVIYAGYLHARSTAGWRGTRSAWISVIGLASIVFNLFVINFLVSGLHSYAGPGLN
jgi:cytochrome c-type biogenesis protein CcsB